MVVDTRPAALQRARRGAVIHVQTVDPILRRASRAASTALTSEGNGCRRRGSADGPNRPPTRPWLVANTPARRRVCEWVLARVRILGAWSYKCPVWDARVKERERRPCRTHAIEECGCRKGDPMRRRGNNTVIRVVCRAWAFAQVTVSVPCGRGGVPGCMGSGPPGGMYSLGGLRTGHGGWLTFEYTRRASATAHHRLG